MVQLLVDQKLKNKNKWKNEERRNGKIEEKIEKLKNEFKNGKLKIIKNDEKSRKNGEKFKEKSGRRTHFTPTWVIKFLRRKAIKPQRLVEKFNENVTKNRKKITKF